MRTLMTFLMATVGLAIGLYVTPTSFVAPVSFAQSVSGEQVQEFLISVGCSALPEGTCDALDATNANNIYLTYRAALSSRFCNTGNINAAKTALATDNAPYPYECAELVRISGAN